MPKKLRIFAPEKKQWKDLSRLQPRKKMLNSCIHLTTRCNISSFFPPCSFSIGFIHNNSNYNKKDGIFIYLRVRK